MKRQLFLNRYVNELCTGSDFINSLDKARKAYNSFDVDFDVVEDESRPIQDALISKKEGC